MSKKFTLDQLTEGIRQRHQGDSNKRLTEKWARTGLLRGLDGVHRENMASLLENQAGQILREQNTLGGGGLTPAAASGDIRGFTNIAFPIVRRVFGGLVANELVSIQPMSLPSGPSAPVVSMTSPVLVTLGFTLVLISHLAHLPCSLLVPIPHRLVQPLSVLV
jgi:hypothetical protein